MRSFRARRQGTQWGPQGDNGWAIDDPVTPGSPFDEVDQFSQFSSVGGGGGQGQGGQLQQRRSWMRRRESLERIAMPISEDRELNGGRMVNEEAVYSMRKKWISDRLIER